MSDILEKSNIYFDEVDKISILKPEVSKVTNSLKDECQIYVEKVDEFQKMADKFIEIVERFSKEVERQKMKAIGARNFLQCMEKQKENNYQQLQDQSDKLPTADMNMVATTIKNAERFSLGEIRDMKADKCVLFLTKAIISEKTMELEKLTIQLNSLQKTEMEKNDLIHQLTSY